MRITYVILKSVVESDRNGSGILDFAHIEERFIQKNDQTSDDKAGENILNL